MHPLKNRLIQLENTIRMETRTIEQVKSYQLVLNPMTANAESKSLVAISYDKEKLLNWYNSQKVEPYRDGNWHKVFAKGSPLEWYNDERHLFDWSAWGHGIHEEWTTVEAIQNYIQYAQNSFGFVTIPILIL